MSNNGTVLMLMDNVVFRKVLPEQIQMAIAAQSTPEDDAWMIWGVLYVSIWSTFNVKPPILSQEWTHESYEDGYIYTVYILIWRSNTFLDGVFRQGLSTKSHTCDWGKYTSIYWKYTGIFSKCTGTFSPKYIGIFSPKYAGVFLKMYWLISPKFH